MGGKAEPPCALQPVTVRSKTRDGAGEGMGPESSVGVFWSKCLSLGSLQKVCVDNV